MEQPNGYVNPTYPDQGLSGYAFRGEIGYGYTRMPCI